MSDYLDPLARSSTVETMRRMIEAAEHERDVAQSMVKGRDDEIERLRARLAEADSLLATIRNNASRVASREMADLMAWGIADGIEVYFADRREKVEQRTADLIVNHAEAEELASFKQADSNLARCYLDARGDLAVARIDLANAEMRERHLRAERDEREARLAEAKQLLKDATPRMMRRHPSSQSSYRSAWDRWLDRRNAFLNWRNDLGE